MHEHDQRTFPGALRLVESGSQMIALGDRQEQAIAAARRAQRIRHKEVTDGLQIRPKPGEALLERRDRRERGLVGWRHLRAECSLALRQSRLPGIGCD